ncbi:MAG: carbohydrate kinase [candidate division Zixibacteria bacterium]|nr:carbohydrate kinase [candidate division Zixibacteria bacterium]
MCKQFDCIGLGIAPADLLFQIHQYPRPGEKVNATDLIVQGGGPVPTAMVTMTRLGMTTAVICAVGDDMMGRFTIDELKRAMVDTSLIVKKKRPSAIAAGWVEDGSGRRTIALDLKIRVTPRDLDLKQFPETRAVHLDGRDMPACMKLARWARRNGVIVSFDVGSMRNDVSAILPLVDHLVCAEDFALPFTGSRTPKAAIEKLRKICKGTIVVTSGIKGSLGFSDEAGLVKQHAFRVETVDTTGAGDAYHGAYLAGLLRGMDLEERMTFASATAALKCTGPGARTAIPNLSQVRRLIKKGGPRYA